MILETLLLSVPSLSCQRLYSCVVFLTRGMCAFHETSQISTPNPARLITDIWLSGVKFPDIIIIHRGWSEWKYYCNYTTWTPKHVHTFIFTHACTHAHMHARTHAHMHTCTHTHRHTHMHTLSHAHTRAHTHTHSLAVCCTYNMYLQTDRCKRGHTGRSQSHSVVISNQSNSESVASFE